MRHACFCLLIALGLLLQFFTLALVQEALPTIPMEGFWQQKAFGLALG
jgi:hypothetical protein